MLDQIMNLVRQQSGDAIINNQAIPNSQNDDAISAVSTGILGGLQQQATGGGLGDLIGMFTGQGGGDAQPVTQGVQQNVQENLMQRLGISPQVAMGIAAAVVPMVLSRLRQKAQDPNDASVNPNDVLGAATGRQGIDWMGAAQSAMRDGRLDMSDLMRVAGGALGGGGGQQQGGGLGGMLGGLFGR